MSTASPADQNTTSGSGSDNAAASSDVTEKTTSQATSQDASNDSTAGSSPAVDEGGKPAGSMLDAVSAALGESKQPVAAPGQESGQEGSEGEAEEGQSEEDIADDPTDEELSKYHSKTRRRVKRLLKQRDDYKTQFENTQQELTGFYGGLRDAGVTQPGLEMFLNFSRLSYSDPKKALEAIEPVLNSLRMAAGEVLPADLEEKVRLGQVDDATARELAQTRANAARANSQANAATEQAARTQTTTQIREFSAQVQGALNKWETTWSGSDPDYKAKKPFVAQEIERRILKDGFPRTVEAAVQLADQVKKDVEDQMRTLLPKKQHVQTPTGGSVGKTSPQPQSMMDVINAVVG